MRSSYIRLISLAILAFAFAACEGDEERFAEHISRGDAYFENEEYEEATIEFKNALQIDPNSSVAHFKLAQAHLKNKNPREGFWEMRETVRLDPQNYEAKIQLAQMLILAREFEESLTHSEEVIAAKPERVEAYVLKAQALELLKREDEALEAFEKAVEVAPREQGPMLLLAHALNRRGDREKAELWYRKLTESSPTFVSYSALATFLAEDRDPSRVDEVEAAFRKAVELAEPSEMTRAYSLLAGFLYNQERTDEAISTLEEGIEKADDKLDLMYTLARYHTALGNEQQADALIEQATVAQPDTARPYLFLSAYRDRKGDLEGSLAAAQKAVEVEPDNETAKLRLAEVTIEMGVQKQQEEMIAEGRALVEAFLERDPNHAGALVIKSKIDLYEKKLDDAVTALRSAVNQRPDWAQAHFVLGTALAMQGEETAARAELARALEIDASLLQARRVLTQVHASLRENEYAVEEGRRYLRERPDDVQTRILVAQSLMRLGKGQEAESELAMIPEESRNAEVRYALGRIAIGKGDLAQAREYLTSALEELDNHPDILRSLYLLDRNEGRLAESVARVDAAIEAEPEDPRLYLLRGDIAQAMGRREDTEKSYQKAVEVGPEYLAAYESLARFYATTGRLQEAIDTYEAAVKARPETAEIYHLLGVLYELGGQQEQAIDRYENAIRLEPNLGEAKNNLAYLFADSGKNLDRALDLAQEAKALLPDSPNAADTLGWVLYKRGVPSAAIGYLKEAEAGSEAGSTSLGIVRYHLAMAYEANGDTEEAVETLRRALTDLETQLDEIRDRGGVAEEPSWATEARAMLERLSRTRS